MFRALKETNLLNHQEICIPNIHNWIIMTHIINELHLALIGKKIVTVDECVRDNRNKSIRHRSQHLSLSNTTT